MVEPAAANAETEVTVKDLFQNLPALIDVNVHPAKKEILIKIGK